jgi:exosortase A
MTIAAINDAFEDDAAAPASPWLAPIFAYGGLVIALIVVLHPTAFSMAKTWATSSAYIHGFAVAPITFWMISAKARCRLAGGSVIPGMVIMIGAAILWLMGRAATVSLIEQISFVSLLIGAVGVVFGARALRDWAFPLAFLYFMVPFGEVLIPHLQTITAQMTIALLSLAGANVSLDGNLIYTPAGIFEVAEACAGLRFLIAAVMIAAVFSYLNFQSWAKRITFLLFAASVAIIANGVRVFLIILAATLTQNKLAIGPDHVLVGWLFYALVFFVLISVGVKYTDNTAERDSTGHKSELQSNRIYIRTIPALIILLLTAGYGFFVVDRPVVRAAPASLTLLNAPGWRILPPPGNWRASLPDADRTVAATYTTRDSTVYLAIGYFTHDRREAEIATYSNRAWDGEYWRKTGAANEVVYLFGESKDAGVSMLSGPERRRLAVVTAYWFDGQVYFKPWRMKLAQMKAKLRGVNPVGGVVMIAASYRQHPNEAVQTIREFTSDLEPLHTWLARNRAQ